MVEMETGKQHLLKLLDLRPRMDAIPPGFRTYTRPGYSGSPEQETDEIYRMYEITMLHLGSGIRVGCLVEEDYNGENVEYVVMSNFHIITSDGRNLSAMNVDLDTEEVITASGKIRFKDISGEPE